MFTKLWLWLLTTTSKSTAEPQKGLHLGSTWLEYALTCRGHQGGLVNDLAKLRDGIDAIDEELLELLNKRGELVVEVGKLKSAEQREMYVPSRERAIFERLEKLNRGPFPAAAVFRVFREIISASLALEHPMKVVYLGPQATFTHAASLQLFGNSAQLVSEKTIRAVFHAVAAKRAQYGVVPIENSNEGAVTHTLDMFADSELKIIAETYMDVSHDLLSRGDAMEGIQRIYSHPQALEQCRRWLEDNCPGIQLIEVESTARAAQMVSEEDQAAAIASSIAANLYRLRVLATRIQDNHHNLTRFLVMGTTIPEPTGNDKTSILFRFSDQPGILARMLEPFRKRNLNLAKIESRPVKKRAWEYQFFLDIEGHIHQPPVAEAVDELRGFCDMVKLLGSYPRAR